MSLPDELVESTRTHSFGEWYLPAGNTITRLPLKQVRLAHEESRPKSSKFNNITIIHEHQQELKPRPVRPAEENIDSIERWMEKRIEN
jgi:hypothetical protein